MNTSLTRHLRLDKVDTKNSCIDGFNHKSLIKVQSTDAAFEFAFSNISSPNSVRQLSGEPRNSTPEELKAASDFYGIFLRGAVSESLMDDKPNVDIAIIIMKSLGHDEFFTNLVLAKKLRVNTDYENMHSLLTKTLGFNSDSDFHDTVVDSIIHQVKDYLNIKLPDNLEG